MAINLCSDSPGFVMSPRISFSHNLCQNDVVQIESRHQDYRSDSTLLDSNFDFCISNETFKQESSSADELFSDGKILPLLVTEKLVPRKFDLPPPQPSPRPSPITTTTTTDLASAVENSKKESLKGLKEIMEMSNLEAAEKSSSSSKSFWRFKRSSSCGNGYKRSLICSLPLLSRSNSTGSAPNNPKSSKDNTQKQKPAPLISSSKSSSSSSYSSSQKPPLKKNNYGSYSNINGVRINPVLNVPPPYISKGTANFLGLGSFFGNGKDKNNKKK